MNASLTRPIQQLVEALRDQPGLDGAPSSVWVTRIVSHFLFANRPISWTVALAIIKHLEQQGVLMCLGIAGTGEPTSYAWMNTGICTPALGNRILPE